jgi:membrane protein
MGTVAGAARRVGRHTIVRDLVRGYAESDLLTYGSAIAFQVLFALIPLALFGFGLFGFLGLGDLYGREVAPAVKNATSPEVFKVVDLTVRKVLNAKQGFWISFGAVIAVWEMSGAVRAVMQVFDRIYGCERERSFRERYVTSTLLALGAGTLLLAAVAASQLVPLVVDGFLAWLRWPLAIALMMATIGLLVHFAPAERRAWQVVSAGTAIVVTAWTLTSVAFGFYVTKVADYGSIFGNLATVIVVFEYLYLSACAFLTGALVDALKRGRAFPD